MKTIVIIPALDPKDKMIILVKELLKLDFTEIIVVDDGSIGKEFKIRFRRAMELGCTVIHHEKNCGKGKAIKTAIKYSVEKYGKDCCFITVDSDGQHLPEDVKRVADAAILNKNKLVLGIRNFDGDNVPFKSRNGNKITSVFFKMSTGVECKDTQTGLRAIPPNLIDLALETEGERYEYEMNFLMDAVKKTKLYYVEFETVYENNNSGSHFRPIKDSARIYAKPLKYAGVALSSAVLDYVLFCILFAILNIDMKVILAVVIARMCSGFYNFYLNRKVSFKSKNKTIPDMVRYLILFFTQMAASAGFVIMISSFGITEQISKLLVDTTLFFISYRIQKNWVFAEKGKGDDLKQKEKRRIRFNIYGIVYGLVLFSYTVYTLLYTFVLPQKSVKLSDVTGNSQLSVSDTTTMVYSTTESSDEIVATDTTYESSTLSVTIDTIRRYDTTIYVADVVVKDASVLQSGLAEDTFGKNIKETTSEIADYYGAILAINGDYYGFRDEGYVMRNGYLYRSEAASGDDNEDLVVYEDGSFEIINESEVTAEELQAAGATQIYSFGPGLIIYGEVVVDEDTEVDRAMGSNPRTAIGMVEPLHYILVVSDGRTDESEGLTLDELAEVMEDYGCTQAYNLDGGGSSTMVFNGTVINNPTSNGRSEKERSVSDIVYFK